ncbi:MAG: chemotaxis protein CheW [Methanoregula sp.]|nr:chemotaxis protein CheW [Methanoregula sp.]
MTARASEPGKAARAHDPVEEKAEDIQIVEFVLGSERFAVDLFNVREVVEYTTITRLPNVPAYVRGIIDLRGEITMIIDLKHRLNIPGSGGVPADSSRIIVLDDTIARSKIGILVDDVTSVSTFEARQVDYTSASVNREETAIIGIIKRMTRVRDKEINELIIWIDIKKLLADIDASL